MELITSEFIKDYTRKRYENLLVDSVDELEIVKKWEIIMISLLLKIHNQI